MANYFSNAIQSIYPQMEKQYGDVVGNYINPNLLSSELDKGQYNQLSDAAYGINRDTGNIGSIGLNDQQQANILGLNSDGTGLQGVNPMTDQQASDLQLTGTERAQIMGNPYMPQDVANQNLATATDAAGRGAQQLQQAAGQYGNAISGSVNPSAIGLDPALQGRIQGAIGQEAQTLGGAANNPNLGLSGQFQSQYKVTPQDQQNIVNAAGSAAGGVYNAANQQLQQQAQAEGNASPLAIQAESQNLERQGANAAGNAMTQAQIGAKQLQLGTTQTAEQMRLGSAQDIASRQMQAGESLAGTQVGATQTAQQQEIGAAEAGQGLNLQAQTTAGNLGYNAALTGYGTGMNTLNAGLNNVQNAAYYGNTNEQQQAAQLAQNRQNIGLTTQQQQYSQGMGVNNAMSNRYGNVYGTNLNQGNIQRNYLTGMYGSNVGQQQTGINQRLNQIGTQGNMGINAYQSANQNQSPSIWGQLASGAAGAAQAFGGF